jgi:glucose-6-phosphate isomerase
MTQLPGFRLSLDNILSFISMDQIEEKAPMIQGVARQLDRREGPGADYLGWLDLPETMMGKGLARLEDHAEKAREDSGVIVVIGIGGSYLGAEAVLAALTDRCSGPEIIFAGTHLSSPALKRLLARIGDRDVRLCMISKSGTTLEPAVSFRLFRELMIKRYGREKASRRITAITDSTHGALKAMSDQEGYETFVIPDDVGGRFSVFTAVGLLPLAIAGLDVRTMLNGARGMKDACTAVNLSDNPAHLYAAVRSCLYDEGFNIEVLSTFNPDLGSLQEWWKQLYGESEGKEGRGIFPAACSFTTDLHSMGQYIQDGRRELFETFLVVDSGEPCLAVPADTAEPDGADLDRDGLAYLVGRTLDDINEKAYQGTRKAHTDGGVPNMSIELEWLDEATMGGLLFFYEKAVAISGRLLGVNPFDQPGVEAYKKEMFKLLGKS